jgi:hypothetical protein
VRRRFWGSALVVALAFALAAALFLPYERLRLVTEADRWRAWLLTLWTGGVMAVLFGAAGLLGYGDRIGFREVREAGSLQAAIERRRAQQRAPDAGFHANFAWWLVSTGGVLIGIYFAAWVVLRG